MASQFHEHTGSRGIEWCDETVNPVGGCEHACRWEMPDGTIAECYAETLAEHGVAKKAYPRGFSAHYWRPVALKALKAGDEARLKFCDSMSDLFAANVPEDHVRTVLNEMHGAPHHVFLTLTKAAPQLLKYMSAFPPNLWIGVSSPPDWFRGKRLSREQQKAMLRRSLEVLGEVKEGTGNLVWMSAEPISWDLTAVIDRRHPLDWVVVGAASHGRKTFQPREDDVANMLAIMDATGTPVFYKGNIRDFFAHNDLGSAELNRWREDFPGGYRDGSPIPAVARRQQQCRRYGWTESRSFTPRRAAGTRRAPTHEPVPTALA
jgi:protein gp37